MEEEYATLMRHETCHLVPSTLRNFLIDYKWVYRIKKNVMALTILKHVFAKSFKQNYGEDMLVQLLKQPPSQLF
jgi:hypothetical protein